MFVFIQQKGPDGRLITRLMGQSGAMLGRVFRLEQPLVKVGSGSHNQIVVPLPHVASEHFQIDLRGEQPALINLGGQGGTLVNGFPVEHVLLEHGAHIDFGQVFEDDDSEEATAVGPLPTKRMEAAFQADASIVISQRAVESSFDDIRSVLGHPSARWGTGKSPSTPPAKFHPPGQERRSQPPPAPWQEKKLEVLLAVNKALSRPEEIEQKVDRVLELLFDTMDIDRCAALVLGADDKPEEATSFVWSAYRDRQGPTAELNLSSTVIYKVLRESVAVMTQDAQSEDWLDNARSVLGQAIRTCICTPLRTPNGVLGVLYADSAKTSYPFSGEDMEFFTSFSNQAAIAIENARLLRVALEKERLEQDLRVARRIQRWLYPRETPHIPGYSLAGESIAMDDVGGDYFDYIPLDDEHIALIVGDVSGHGISAALVMTMTRSILRGSLRGDLSPAEVLMRVNALVSEDMITRMFVTMLLLVFNTRTGTFQFANAGHNAPIQYSAYNGNIQEVPEQRGKPIGMSRWARVRPNYQNATGRLLPGDCLCLYTDGFPEAANPQEELMEMERFFQAISLAATVHDAKGILAHLFETMHQFQAGAPVTDDVTAIVLKREL